MTNIMLIALGGGSGAVVRFLVMTAIQRFSGWSTFPFGTLIVNVTGCFIIGMVSQYGDTTGSLSPTARALIVTGFLGGYTTYSTFANESWMLGADGMALQSMLFMAATLVGGLLAVWAGRSLVVALVG